MADLKSLNRRIEKTRAKKAELPKKPPRIDRSQEKAVKTSQVAITGALTMGFKSIEALLQKLLKRPMPDPVNPEGLSKAVAEGVAEAMGNIKPQKITFPARKPVSYQATIQRRGKTMTGALIEPIIK